MSSDAGDVFYLDPAPLLAAGPNARAAYYFCKRGLDLFGGILLLVLLSPALALIALLIRLDSEGPVLFVQERVGARRVSRDGEATWERRIFRIYKFRSMVHNADESLHRSHVRSFVAGRIEPNRHGYATYKLREDPRVTRVGRFLRQTSLDELPQILNVIRGEMSFVGPRPTPPYEVQCYEPWHCDRLLTLPGITGLWQVSGRSDLSFDAMIQLDLEYVRNQSIWLDLKILARTIPTVLSGAGAE
jgi:lipopolysaccharide/colanic/teichoic acid biosynthesis glycosyltransferase